MPMSFFGGSAEDGNDGAGGHRLGQRGQQLLVADAALQQVLFHQGVIGFDDGVDELRALGRQVDGAAGRRWPAG